MKYTLTALDWVSRRTAAFLGVLNRAVGARLGLNATDIDILGLLNITGTVTPSRLAQISGLGTGTVTLVIDRLEKAGFVKRVPGQETGAASTSSCCRAASKKRH